MSCLLVLLQKHKERRVSSQVMGIVCAFSRETCSEDPEADKRQRLVESEASFNCRLWTTEEFTPNQSSLAVSADTEASAEPLTGFAVHSSSLLRCGKRRTRFLFLLPTFAGLWDLTQQKTRCCAATIEINKRP